MPALLEDHHSEPARSWDPMDKTLVARLLVGAAILALFVMLAIQNAASVDVQLAGWTFQVSGFLLMVLCAVAGVAIWELVGAYSRRARKKSDKANNTE